MKGEQVNGTKLRKRTMAEVKALSELLCLCMRGSRRASATLLLRVACRMAGCKQRAGRRGALQHRGFQVRMSHRAARCRWSQRQRHRERPAGGCARPFTVRVVLVEPCYMISIDSRSEARPCSFASLRDGRQRCSETLEAAASAPSPGNPRDGGAIHCFDARAGASN